MGSKGGANNLKCDETTLKDIEIASLPICERKKKHKKLFLQITCTVPLNIRYFMFLYVSFYLHLSDFFV